MDYFYISIAIKLIVGMVGLIVVTRLLGKKEMSQITPLDFVYALVLGGIVEESLYDEAADLGAVLIALVVWGILIFAIEKVTQKIDWLRHIVKGTPTYMIEDGKVNIRAMQRNKLNLEELRELLRLNGVFSLSEVSYAILENNGQLSVLKKAGEEPIPRKELQDHFPENKLSYLLVEEGVIDKRALKLANKSEEWVQEQLQKRNYKVEEIQFAEWSPNSGFHMQLKE